MHNAPPVAYPVGRFVWAWAWFVGVFMVSAAGLLIWQTQSQTTEALVWGAWACWAVCASATAYGVPKQTLSEGHLLWSGQAWLWQSRLGVEDFLDDDQGLDVTVGVDLGDAMLVFLRHCHATPQWRGRMFCAWVSEQSMPSKWHGFRCAVYSRPMAEKLPKGLAL
jgi:hypothetical protein